MKTRSIVWKTKIQRSSLLSKVLTRVLLLLPNRPIPCTTYDVIGYRSWPETQASEVYAKELQRRLWMVLLLFL